jgi:sulfur relay (sulfurtransferase) complex TusBCD TusD component (DsrE family)
MAKFTFVVSTEPYKYQGIESMLNLAEATLKKATRLA